MIPRSKVVDYLRNLGFRYTRETDYNLLYRAGPRIAVVPKKTLLSKQAVKEILRRAGVSSSDADKFIASEAQ